MSYRSEVMIKLPEHRWEEYNKRVETEYARLCKKNNVSCRADEIYSGGDIEHHDGDEYYCPYVSIHFDWVKWYESYFDVTAIMTTLYDMNAELGMSYAFARSGEESGDFDIEYAEGEKEEKGKDVPYCNIVSYIE